MADDQKSLAERLFELRSAESELEEQLVQAGVEFERIGWDWYDCSLEIYGVQADARLSEEAQRVVHEAGFAKVYVNHVDKWETHYTWKAGDFKPVKGWRVSYPHKRNDGTKNILVEDFMPGWPKEWFDSGYVLIKKLLGHG